GYFWLDYVWTHMWEFLAPLPILLYVFHVLKHPYRNARWLPWLLFPFGLSVLCGLSFDLSYIFHCYEHPLIKNGPGHLLYRDLEETMALFLNIALLGWSFWLVHNDKSLPRKNRKWLRNLLIAMLSVIVLWYLVIYVHKNYQGRPDLAIWLALSSIFWWIGYNWLYRQQLITGSAIAIPKKVIVVAAYPMGAAKTQEYISHLADLMEREKLYCNPRLSRRLVADRLGISEGYFSQLINEKLGVGFTDYVNNYRIQLARNMLLDPAFAAYSLAAIGLEAGFNSRSAFYRTFKKATGRTPGAFREAGAAS
ncbi:MAG: helix-turn-helix domain-containing protein, partial [Bacteroidota bacterium]